MAIQKRGKSYSVKIFNKGTLVNQKSFPTEAAAKAWENVEKAKVTLGKLGYDYDGAKSSDAARHLVAELGDLATPDMLINLIAAHLTARPPIAAPTVAPAKTAASSGPTFGDLIARYKKEVTANKRGYIQENSLFRSLVKHKLAATPVASLTTADFESWAKEQLKTVSGDTVNRRFSTIHHMLEQAKIWKMTMPIDSNGNTINPAKVKRQPQAEPRDFRLSPAERACLFRHAQAKEGDSMTLPLELCFEINFRRGELFQMKRADIDWAGKKITLAARTTKNGKVRHVPLTTRAIAILRRAVEVVKPDYLGRVFPYNGDRFCHRFVSVRKLAAAEMPRIANFRFHDTRHEAISVMATKIPNAVMLAKATGHGDLKMLSRYVNPSADELADMLE